MKKKKPAASRARSASTPKSISKSSLFVLALIMVINAVAYGSIIPLLYPYAARFGIGPVGLGLLFASFSFMQLIATPVLGRLSDKYGRKPVLLFCLFGTGLSLAMFAGATTIPMLFIARMIDGVTGGTLSVAQAVVADSTEGNERAKGFGVLMAAFGFGFLVGPALGGLMSQFGLAAPFWFSAVIAMIGTVLGIIFLKETLPPHKRQTSKEPLFNIKALGTALFSPVVGVVLGLSLLSATAQNSFIIGVQSFTNDVLHLSPLQIGLMFTGFGVISTVMQMFGLQWWLARMPSKKTIITISLVGSMITMAGLFLTRTPILFFPILYAFAIISSAIMPMIAALISERTKGEDQGIILGINQSYTSLGQIIGPLLAGLVAARVSIPAIFLLAAVFYLASVITARGLFGQKLVKVDV
jgi:multidrug resistance protein